MVVDVERIWQGEEVVAVRVHGAGIFDDVDVSGRPPGCNIGDHDLLEEAPIARKAYEKGCFLGNVRIWRSVPCCYWRKIVGAYCRCGEG